MKRLIEKIVFCGLVTAWRLATVPTSRSPPLVNATTDGVVRPPSAFSMTFAALPSITATHEFVVPRSIPMTFAMVLIPFSIAAGWLGPGGVDLTIRCPPKPRARKRMSNPKLH